jgi:hypothetical protein
VGCDSLKRAAWIIFGSVVVVLVAAQFAEEHFQQKSWEMGRGVQW